MTKCHLIWKKNMTSAIHIPCMLSNITCWTNYDYKNIICFNYHWLHIWVSHAVKILIIQCIPIGSGWENLKIDDVRLNLIKFKRAHFGHQSQCASVISFGIKYILGVANIWHACQRWWQHFNGTCKYFCFIILHSIKNKM